ncbi:RNase H domain-containing protein [Trichonephila clavipes]|nr:RNase H domain-containing protein [Trichonephila clavipes]
MLLAVEKRSGLCFGNYQYPLPTGGVASHLHRWLTLGLCPRRWHWFFSHLFSFYLHAGPLTTHFDGEVEAIHIAFQQLAVRLPPIERAVILSDSTSALQALSNYNENNCLRVQNCRELLGKIKGNIVFQWVPSHCGLWGNERADFLAKKGTGILQNFRRDLTLHSAKLEIKRIFRESFRLTASRVARDKPWSTLCKKPHGIPSSPRAGAVVKF